jgi:RNA polymerase sigma-70 factor (ECF subfamily)
LKNLVTLEQIAEAPDPLDHSKDVEEQLILNRLLQLVHRLNPVDRQLMLLYLEDMDTASMAEITGLSASHVRTQVHRIKALLARRFREGDAP